jgi:hypothetical protein
MKDESDLYPYCDQCGQAIDDDSSAYYLNVSEREGNTITHYDTRFCQPLCLAQWALAKCKPTVF